MLQIHKYRPFIFAFLISSCFLYPNEQEVSCKLSKAFIQAVKKCKKGVVSVHAEYGTNATFHEKKT